MGFMMEIAATSIVTKTLMASPMFILIKHI